GAPGDREQALDGLRVRRAGQRALLHGSYDDGVRRRQEGRRGHGQGCRVAATREEGTMNDEAARDESLRKYAMLGYALHLLGLVSIIGFVVGLIVAYVKRDDARGTVYESHFRWQT